MKSSKCFRLTILLALLLAGCKDKNNITNEPSGPGPIIMDISPDRGKSGTEVTITGINFGITPEENAVTFNGGNAVVTGAGETELKVEVPIEAGSGTVAVTVAGQTAEGPEFTWFPDNTRFVDGTNGNDQNGLNLCGDPDLPCRTISHAIDISSGGDLIDISSGSYTEENGITIDKNISMQGAGQDSLSGTVIQAHVNPGMADGRVIFIPEGSVVSISDLTIRHGKTADSGGGIYTLGSALTITNVTFERNEAQGGGGMRIDGGEVTLRNVVFHQNSASSWGGGMFVHDCSPELIDVTFERNSSPRGGGMYNWIDAAPSLTDVTFSENTATVDGGGMRNTENSVTTLTRVIFEGNTAQDGGGMSNGGESTSRLTDVTFTRNIASRNGGGIFENSTRHSVLNGVTFNRNTAHSGGGMFGNGAPVLNNVVFTRNIATSLNGGGMAGFNDAILQNVEFRGNGAGKNGGGWRMVGHASKARLTNVLFWDNTAVQWGGGMAIDFLSNGFGPGPQLINVTFSGNSADTGGGIAYFGGDSKRTHTLTNTILWGNITPDNTGNEIFTSAAGYPVSIIFSRSLYKNDEGDLTISGDVIDENSVTIAPIFVDDNNGNLRLQTDSPAINAGDPDTDLSIFATDGNGDPIDLDGNPRVVGGRIDIGAYEDQGN